MSTARSKTTTARGLGWRHQQNRERLLRRHIDGTPCWWCGLPMHSDAQGNWDGRALAADHTIARAVGGKHADRLLHATCNGQRGDGSRDHQRPVLTGAYPGQWAGATSDVMPMNLGDRLMPWP